MLVLLVLFCLTVWTPSHHGRVTADGPKLHQRRHDELPTPKETSRRSAKVYGRLRR
jgi:hypothetical protein